MGSVRFYSAELLDRFCNRAFQRFGFSDEESKIITDVLLLSDLYGIESHGMQRLVRYHRGIEKGIIDVEARWETVFETPLSAVIDGKAGMGQLISHDAMELAIEKAKTSGMAIVTVRDSNHFGIAGYYAKMASDQGLLGMAMTNSEAIMVPTYGRVAMLGSNPIAIAMPAKPYPFLFDASTTVVTRGKLEIYNKQGELLPTGWALDSQGMDTQDAATVLANIAGKKGGGIMPLGGSAELSGSHKGYGYGMICELFCSILSLGLTSNHTHIGNVGGACHGFIAIDPAMFGEPKKIEEHFSTFLQELRDSDKAQGQKRIYTHGEKEIEAYNERLKNGIPVLENTLREMQELCDYLNLNFEEYFGKLEGEKSSSSFY